MKIKEKNILYDCQIINKKEEIITKTQNGNETIEYKENKYLVYNNREIPIKEIKKIEKNITVSFLVNILIFFLLLSSIIENLYNKKYLVFILLMVIFTFFILYCLNEIPGYKYKSIYLINKEKFVYLEENDNDIVL